MTKLADIELNELEEAVIPGNLIIWVRDKLAERIADKYIDKYADYFITHEIKIDKGVLKKVVLDKLSERIIDNYLGS